VIGCGEPPRCRATRRPTSGHPGVVRRFPKLPVGSCYGFTWIGRKRTSAFRVTRRRADAGRAGHNAPRTISSGSGPARLRSSAGSSSQSLMTVLFRSGRERLKQQRPLQRHAWGDAIGSCPRCVVPHAGSGPGRIAQTPADWPSSCHSQARAVAVAPPCSRMISDSLAAWSVRAQSR
jgi:hypothetical protein